MLGDFRLSVQNVWDVFFPTRGSHNTQLCIEMTSNHDNYQSRVKKIMRVKMSKVQDRQYSRCGIEFWYSNLDNLIILQVQVDKKNLMESPLDSVYYLYNYYIVYALLSHIYHMT